MPRIVDCIHLDVSKWTKSDTRNIDVLEHVVVHRIDVGDETEEVIRFFTGNRQYTGGKFPYHFLVHKNGEIHQVVALSKKAPGAKKLNLAGIQVACVGDFRKHKATKLQYDSLVYLCARLVDSLPRLRVIAHDSVPGASSDPNKQCPGKHLSVENLRLDVRDSLERMRRRKLEIQGVCI